MRFNCLPELNASHCRRPAAGFTLIEIVMVLVLLGILAAVAVPKYFDLQEEANTTKCKYHQSLIVKTLYQRFAVSKLEETEFDAQATIKGVMKELGGDTCTVGSTENESSHCEKLCATAGSHYALTATKTSDGNYVFGVSCSIAAHGGISGVVSDGDADAVRDQKTRDLMEKIRELYQLADKWGNGFDLDTYFSAKTHGKNEYGGSVDSELGEENTSATCNRDGDCSMGVLVDYINKALKDEFGDVVWKLERTEGKMYDANHHEVSDWNQIGAHYEANLVLTVVNRPSEGTEAGEVDGTIYQMKVIYSDKENGNTNDRKVKDWGTITKVGDAKVDLKVTDSGKYYVERKGS